MVKQKLTVTVAIPAHNEGVNIHALIGQVLRQSRDNYILKEVLIVSDGSTDNTVSEVRRIKNSKIRVIDHRVRKGKRPRFNEIMRLNTSDVLIQIDADMKFGSRKTISRLVAAFENHPGLGIACAYNVPVAVTTPAGRMAMIGYLFWDDARRRLGSRGTLYYCEGGMRAFSLAFTNQYRIPKFIPSGEDVFSYLWAKKNGFPVVAVKNAKIYFSLPSTYTDYIKQMKRFIKSRNIMYDIFDEDLMEQENTMTAYYRYTSLLRVLLSHPIDGAQYIVVHAYTRIKSFSYKPVQAWDLIKTTK